ncbi:MAG: cytochrome b/b6 domain-containing protein [Alphaproteobacteria bacterium]|nr:cytochrome b/b6 domain-containing protein [Alphaproteobacteria bacterium]
MKTINVWDLPTRAFHWTLAGSIILALIIIGDEGVIYSIHALCGIVALVLVLFRLVWGFVGGEHARFTAFVAGWTAVRQYSLQLLRLAPPAHIGHNPLGGWAVFILLGLSFVAAGTGVLSGGFAGNAMAKAALGIHEGAGSLLQFMVFIHVAGVLVDWVLTRDNIVAAMWHGRKRIEETREAVDARGGHVWLAVIIAAPLVAFGGYVVSQIDLTSAPGASSSESQTENGAKTE